MSAWHPRNGKRTVTIAKEANSGHSLGKWTRCRRRRGWSGLAADGSVPEGAGLRRLHSRRELSAPVVVMVVTEIAVVSRMAMVNCIYSGNYREHLLNRLYN